MEVFFNELSVRIAADDEEAKGWLTELAGVGQLLKKIVESMQEETFAFRRKEDFGEMSITQTATVRAFLSANFDFTDPEYNFLLGIFDSPYITPDDPLRTDYEYMNLKMDGSDYGETGIAAAYLKRSMAISLNSHGRWDTCDLPVTIIKLNSAGTDVEESGESVKHSSQKAHVIDCHLIFLSAQYDWASYRAKFDEKAKQQTLLPLIELYSLVLGDGGWDNFYQELTTMKETERISRIKALADRIAQVQRWEAASGSLAAQNRGRIIFTIPNSNLIVGLDTQHGEFEIHRNQKGNNHLGSLSFDGKRFKSADKGRSLKL